MAGKESKGSAGKESKGSAQSSNPSKYLWSIFGFKASLLSVLGVYGAIVSSDVCFL